MVWRSLLLITYLVRADRLKYRDGASTFTPPDDWPEWYTCLHAEHALSGIPNEHYISLQLAVEKSIETHAEDFSMRVDDFCDPRALLRKKQIAAVLTYLRIYVVRM